MNTNSAALRRKVWNYYRKHGRHDLPWRHTTDPYHILVSEVMLQQTQVNRVLPKYDEFLQKFPSVRRLARVPLRDVLIAWQGLGYNRRARALHAAAQHIVVHFGGKVPQSESELISLPGVGAYTARAVRAFSFNVPVVLIETNIRTVLLHELLPLRTNVPDSELEALAETLVPQKRSREWHWALMDYGAYLKEQGVRTNVQSRHYKKQSAFAGSDRQVRGAIVRVLSTHKKLTTKQLATKTNTAPGRIQVQLRALQKEGLVKKGNGWSL